MISELRVVTCGLSPVSPLATIISRGDNDSGTSSAGDCVPHVDLALLRIAST